MCQVESVMALMSFQEIFLRVVQALRVTCPTMQTTQVIQMKHVEDSTKMAELNTSPSICKSPRRVSDMSSIIRNVDGKEVLKKQSTWAESNKP